MKSRTFTCGSRKPVAPVNRRIGARAITPLTAHSDDATHPLLDFPDRSNLRLLDRPQQWTIHVQRSVCAPVMIIAEVFGQESPHMSLVQNDHVIQAFAANTPDQPLHIGVLPGTPRGNQHFIDAHTPDTLLKACPVDAVAITQEIPRQPSS